MTANKNEPDKKPAGSAPSQAGNRPHATLDLKATEVAPPPAAETTRPGLPRHPPRTKAAAQLPRLPQRAPPGPELKSAASGPLIQRRRVGGTKRPSPPAPRLPHPPHHRARRRADTAASSRTSLPASPAASWRCSPPTSSPPSSASRRPTGPEQRRRAGAAHRARSKPGPQSARRPSDVASAPRRRRDEARQARAARRQHRRHREEAGPARRDAEGESKTSCAPKAATRGATARIAKLEEQLVADVVGRRERPASGAPAAARRDHRQARRSRIDDGESARRAAQERRPGDRHAARPRRPRRDRPRAPARSAWTASSPRSRPRAPRCRPASPR